MCASLLTRLACVASFPRLAVGSSVLATVLLTPPLSRAAAPDLFLSEVVEGSSNNKAVEIYNGTGATVDLAAGGYRLEIYFNANTEAETTIALAGILADGDVFVVADADATGAILSATDQESGENFFNGNDSVVLKKGAAIVDSFGKIGENPSEQWSDGGVRTKDRTLRRKPTVCAGDTDPDDDFDPSLDWVEFPKDTFGGLGEHLAECGVISDPEAVEIFEIQGSGLASPYEGQNVLAEDNVVTLVGPRGFFLQTPAERDDLDPETSNGLYVYTGSAPGVQAGDRVDVDGRVSEFYGLTEFSDSPTVTVRGAGPLPPAVTLDAATPSPDPDAPTCASGIECLEGMLVRVPQGTVSGPHRTRSSDPIAELEVVARGGRAFREPGVEYPGLGGTIPTWDGNPEIFELDPDALGLANQTIPAGSTFSATGALAGFEGGAELWPSELSVDAATLPRPVRPAAGDEITVGSLNLARLFDDADDPDNDDSEEAEVSAEEYGRHRAKLSRYVREVLRSPDVLAVQEAENLNVLVDLATDISAADPAVVYAAHLVEGHDIGGIDVGFLTRRTVTAATVTQLGAGEIFSFPGRTDRPLHDRPPLRLEATFAGGFEVAVLTVHLRSLGNITHPTDGARVRQKRLEQAQSVAQMVQDFQSGQPDVPLVVIGDFNAFQFTDGYVDVLGQISGDVDPAACLLAGPDLVAPNLTNEVLRLPAAERYSFVYRGSAQVLDHALTSRAAATRVSGFAYGRGNADAALQLFGDETTALRASDHDGLVLYLKQGPQPPCDSPTAISLNEHFCVEVEWRDFEGNTGLARVVPYRSADSGMFWFFAENNWEMLVKVIDGCGFNGRYWVFAAATTNVEYTLRVTDTRNGRAQEYFNPLGNASPAITDIEALDTCDGRAPGRSTLRAPADAVLESLPAAVARPVPSAVSRRVKVEACAESSTAMCLNRERFLLEVEWRDFEGNTGSARVVPYGSADSGMFWFFGEDNWEMLVKVIDGCGFNDRFWVFAAATTNVEYTLRVTDTQKGKVREYFNPLGTAADAITDTGALDTCP